MLMAAGDDGSGVVLGMTGGWGTRIIGRKLICRFRRRPPSFPRRKSLWFLLSGSSTLFLTLSSLCFSARDTYYTLCVASSFWVLVAICDLSNWPPATEHPSWLPFPLGPGIQPLDCATTTKRAWLGLRTIPQSLRKPSYTDPYPMRTNCNHESRRTYHDRV